MKRLGFRSADAGDGIHRRLSANPIVLKEMRQMARSGFLSTAILWSLFLQLAVSSIFLLSTTRDSVEPRGEILFGFLFTCLCIVTCLSIPTYTVFRLARERSGTSADLLFATSLTPGAIVRGKLYSGLILAVLLVSLSAPFLTITYFLRGISVQTIFLALSILMVIVAFLLVVSISIGCNFRPGRKRFSVVMWAGIAQMAVLWPVLIYVAENLSYHGRTSPGLTETFATLMELCAAASAFLFACSVYLLTPATANRSLPVRATATALWLASGGVLWGVGSTELLLMWATYWAAFVGLMCLWAATEPEEQGRRVRRAIPRNNLLRCAAFPFFTGSANGFVWALLVGGCTIAAGHTLGRTASGAMGTVQQADAVARATAFFCHAVAVCLIARFLRRRIGRGKAAYGETWAVAAAIIGLESFVPLAVAHMRHIPLLSPRYNALIVPTVSGAMADKSSLAAVLTAALVWLAAGIALNIGWLLSRGRAFSPLSPEDETAVP